MNNNESKKNNIKKLIFIIILVLVIFIIINTISIKKQNKGNKDEKNITKEDKEKWKISYGTSPGIMVYENENLVTTIKEGETSNLDGLSFKNTYKCVKEDCKVYDTYYNKKYVLIKDDGYLIYNYKNDLYKSIMLDNMDYNEVSFCAYNNKVYGLFVLNNNGLYAFYSLKDEAFTTDFLYSYINNDNNIIFTKNYFIGAIKSYDESLKYYIVNFKTGEKLIESDVMLGAFGNNKYVYYYKNYSNDLNIDAEIYDSNFNLMFDGKRYYDLGVSKAGNIAVSNYDSFSVYNKNGSLIKTSKNYKQIIIIFNDYVVLVDNDDYLKIVDYDGTVVAKFIKLTDNYVFHKESSKIIYKEDKTIINLMFENKDLQVGVKGYIVWCYYVLDNGNSGVIQDDKISN